MLYIKTQSSWTSKKTVTTKVAKVTVHPRLHIAVLIHLWYIDNMHVNICKRVLPDLLSNTDVFGFPRVFYQFYCERHWKTLIVTKILKFHF